MKPRTANMARCLKAIRRLTVDGQPPTLLQLAAALGYAHRSAVHGLLVDMRERGLVTWEPGRQQSLRIVEDEITRSDLERLSDAALDRLHTDIGLELNRRAHL